MQNNWPYMLESVSIMKEIGDRTYSELELVSNELSYTTGPYIPTTDKTQD